MTHRDTWGVSWPPCGCDDQEKTHRTLSEVLACRKRRKETK